MERIEELESADAHKQKRMKCLQGKFNSWKNSRKNGRAGKCSKISSGHSHVHVQIPAEHQVEQPQDQHVKWVNTRKGEEKNQPSKNENGRVTVENPTKRELIGRPIITGRRKGLERRRYDTAVRNVEATLRSTRDSKNFKCHRKLDRIRWSKTHNHDVADKLLSQLNTFSQAITDYVRTTAQGRVPTPTGNT